VSDTRENGKRFSVLISLISCFIYCHFLHKHTHPHFLLNLSLCLFFHRDTPCTMRKKRNNNIIICVVYNVLFFFRRGGRKLFPHTYFASARYLAFIITSVSLSSCNERNVRIFMPLSYNKHSGKFAPLRGVWDMLSHTAKAAFPQRYFLASAYLWPHLAGHIRGISPRPSIIRNWLSQS
jgi:hypothetical protein